MKKPPQKSRLKQREIMLSAEEILDQILGFIESHFYPQQRVIFLKDKPRLLDWVVFEPARWLDSRAVTIDAQSYLDLFLSQTDGVLMEAIRHGQIETVRYRPAYLRQVIQSRLRIRGDALYALAKGSQALIDHTMLSLGRMRGQAKPDPIRQLAAAATLLRTKRHHVQHPRKGSAQGVRDTQMGLF